MQSAFEYRGRHAGIIPDADVEEPGAQHGHGGAFQGCASTGCSIARMKERKKERERDREREQTTSVTTSWRRGETYRESRSVKEECC